MANETCRGGEGALEFRAHGRGVVAETTHLLVIVQSDCLPCDIGAHFALGLAVQFSEDSCPAGGLAKLIQSVTAGWGESRSVLSPKSRMRSPLLNPRAGVALGLSGG